MLHIDGGAADDGDVAQQMVLTDDELIELHQLQDGEESDDDLRLGGGRLEHGIKTQRLARFEMIQKKLDFIGHSEAVVDDIAEIVGFLEAFEHILKRTNEVEDGNFREGGRLLGRLVAGIGLVGETALLIELAKGEEAGGVFEFFVFDELADQFPTRIIILDIVFGRLFAPGQEGSGFQIHQIGCHDDELGGEVDVQKLEGIDVIEVLLGDFLDRDRMDIQLVFFDQIEQEIQGALENFELDFVIGGFQGVEREELSIFWNLIWQDLGLTG